MSEPHARTDGNGDEENSSRVSRRHLLGSVAGASVGVAGLGAATDSASAAGFTGCDDWLDAPAEYPEIDLTSSNPTASNVDALEDEDEFAVYVHGWLGLETSTDQAYTLEQALEDEAYDAPVVAASWEADTLNYWRAEGRTETAGRRLASWLSTVADTEDATIRLVGHSLGGRVCLETLLALEDTAVESVALLGTAADDDSVCTDGRYAYGIATSGADVYNYHSGDDDSVCYGYDVQSLSSGLGCGGADCTGSLFTDDQGTTPEEYTDVDVTDTVDDHCDYAKPDVGCVPRVVDDFE
ncbi:alpha/beta hydrolase [Natronobacterium texcoconense]|uniref:Alpha/beta hydrolase family protein n=1 Tax=Natronobacterium texcoconense TaxID=1095778 RepID=A0A1H0YZG7_NATTX|nr:alpha/beta hydrolase [Natronobacterium texcoconense]SDQ20508.1 Alpha/beta hydrolase of unknown function [Natronobacterium texcoconense]